MSISPAFKGAGIKAGLQIWRIENKEPVVWPEKDHGKFYEGDSYICLKTIQKPGKSSFEHDIFFWLGDESSQDEQGIAAYKTVELDESLGGGPVQHRETQGYESEQFLQLFKSVQYLKGGVASGFKKVERGVHETVLLQLKGKRVVRVSPVAVSASSLNAGDVFILVMSDTLIQWNGSEANKKEKAKALDVTKGIRDDERGGKCKILACDQGSEMDAFWDGIGGKGAVAAAVSDDVVETKSAPTLLKVSDAAGSLVKTEIAKGELTKSMLDTSDVYLLDVGSEVFVWTGKGASKDERMGSMKIASDHAAANGTKGTKVTKVMEGAEATSFKANFTKWVEPQQMTFGYQAAAPKRDSQSGGDVVGAMLDGVKGIFGGNKRSSKSFLDSVTPISTEMWRIEDMKPVKVEDDFFGQFYAGDSYIVKYTYKENSKEGYMIYFWQGSESSQDEKGASALIATQMDDEVGGAATQVRVVMGKEPNHFVRLFKGKMVIRSGGKASGFKNSSEKDSYDTDGTELYHVRGSDPESTRAVQVPEMASSLNSGDCFVLLTPETMSVWQGKGANEAELEVANTVADTLKFNRKKESLLEGAETDEFWGAIGGKGEYPSEKVHLDAERDPQLFHISNETGTFKMEQVFDFAQADLEEDDVFLLDCYTSLFLWVGSEANAAEKTKSVETAKSYIEAMKYSPDTSIITVTSGNEPPMFTANFLGWTPDTKKKFVDPYEAKLAAMQAQNPKDEPAPAPAAAPPKRPSASGLVVENVKDPSGTKYSYDELKSGVPAGVDPTKKEQYLSDADFESVMGSPRGEFNAMKPWKQSQIKKAKGLF